MDKIKIALIFILFVVIPSVINSGIDRSVVVQTDRADYVDSSGVVSDGSIDTDNLPTSGGLKIRTSGFKVWSDTIFFADTWCGYLQVSGSAAPCTINIDCPVVGDTLNTVVHLTTVYPWAISATNGISLPMHPFVCKLYDGTGAHNAGFQVRFPGPCSYESYNHAGLFWWVFRMDNPIIEWDAEPLIGRPTDSNVTFNMRSASDIDVRIDVGTDPEALTPVTFANNIGANTTIEDTLGGFNPDTEYYYSILYRHAGDNRDGAFVRYKPAGGTDSVFTFHTARNTGETFKFAVFADPHLNRLVANYDTDVWDNTINNINDDDPDFAVSLGDFCMIDGFQGQGTASTFSEVRDINLETREWIKGLAVETPLFLVLGNHEQEAGYGPQRVQDHDSISVWGTSCRLNQWINPQDDDNFYDGDATESVCCGKRENYWSFEWGDAIFIGLDPYWYTTTNPFIDSGDPWDWTLGEDQHDWLYETLDGTSATWKFIFIHQIVGGSDNGYGRGGVEWAKYSVASNPSYEWGGEDSDGNDVWSTKRSGWTHDPIHDILDNANVNIVFFGHDHTYVYNTLDGVVYQHVGQPGDATYGAGMAAEGVGYTDENNVFKNNSGHVLVTVYGSDSVHVEWKRSVLEADAPLSENGDTVNNKTISHWYTLTP